MNLIEELGIEKCRAIVDGAPEGAVSVNLHNGMYYELREYKRGDTFLSELRQAIAEHDREFKIGDHIRYMGIDRKSPHPEIFEVVGFDSMPVGGNGYKIKNRLGQIDFCYGDNYALVDCDTTDHVTDIRNHVSPSTKVIDHG